MNTLAPSPTSDPQFPKVIDSTMRSAFIACPRQFYYNYILGLSHKRLSIHLHFGATFASGLEAFRRTYYCHPDAGYDRARNLDALYQGFLTILREWGPYPIDAEPPKTLWHCLAALDYYFEVHAPTTDPVQPYFDAQGNPAVEFSFALPMEESHPETGEPLIFGGRFDMLGMYQGSAVVVDEKTTTRLGGSWSKNWDLRGQFKGYMFAARSYGTPVLGAVVRGVALYANRFDHAEAILHTSKWDLTRWWEQLHRDVKRMKQLWAEGYWDWNLDNACSTFGGCAFKNICLTPTPERWVDNDFTIRRWNPLLADPLSEDRETPLYEQLVEGQG